MSCIFTYFLTIPLIDLNLSLGSTSHTSRDGTVGAMPQLKGFPLLKEMRSA
jgi:hypothetical protein